jgi:hypothetical protein
VTEYLGQQLVHLDVRPKKAAFLFRSGSAAQFRAGVERASSRWGGVQEAIVPVSRRGRIEPRWRQIVEILDPDVVFDIAGLDEEARAKAARQLPIDVLPVAMESSPFSGAHPLVVEHRDGRSFASSSRRPVDV